MKHNWKLSDSDMIYIKLKNHELKNQKKTDDEFVLDSSPLNDLNNFMHITHCYPTSCLIYVRTILFLLKIWESTRRSLTKKISVLGVLTVMNVTRHSKRKLTYKTTTKGSMSLVRKQQTIPASNVMDEKHGG